MGLNNTHKNKARRNNLLAALVVPILFFLSIELFLNLVGFNPGPTSAISDPRMRFYGAKYGRSVVKDRQRTARDPLLFWRLLPRPGEVNSRGFRGPKEYSLNKEKGVYRIMCLGDSITYGVWVKTEETYPYVLEQMLNANTATGKFEVINAGVMGYSSLQGLRQLKRDLLRYKPDLITVLFGFDDNHAAIAYSDKEQKTYNRFIFSLTNILRKSKFYDLLEISLRRLKNKLAPDRDNPLGRVSGNIKKRVDPQDYKQNLEEMVEIAKDNNIEILFLRPLIFCLPKREINYLMNYSNMVPREYSVGMLKKFRDYQIKAELFMDGCHFTPVGHWLVAKEIYDTLERNKIVSSNQAGTNIPMPVYFKDSLPEEMKEGNIKDYIKMGENEEHALTFGWQDLERIRDRYARFTQGFQANAYLKNSPPETKGKRLRIEIFSYISNKVAILENNNYLATVTCSPNLWQEAELKFEDNARFLKISICPEKIFKPSVELGSYDDRTLGVAISKIEIVKE
ncbi:MAG: GDSL-type esterase/lipase family protein [Candidatus Omnitrophota bacterium]|nr:GDSL-type esterase/lipase family protein [Candidatus Omnitrophota bacterium]